MERASPRRLDPWRWEKRAGLRAALFLAVELVLVLLWWDWSTNENGWLALLLFAFVVLPGNAYAGAIEATLMLAYALRPSWRPRSDPRTRGQHFAASGIRFACGLVPMVAPFVAVESRRALSDWSYLALHEDELRAAIASTSSERGRFQEVFHDGPRTVICVGSISLGDSLYFIHDPTNSVTEPEFGDGNAFWNRDRSAIVHVDGPWYSWAD